MKNDENKIDKIEKTVGGLASEVRQGFSSIDKNFSRVDKAIEDLATITAKNFERVDKKIESLHFDVSLTKIDVGTIKQDVNSAKSNTTWMRDVLEEHTTILKRLDQERIFSLNYIQRLEKEVEKIKKQLKIA